MTTVVYVDYNATTPIDPEVYEAMRPYLTLRFGNPSSHHAYGRTAALALEEARGQVADLIGARSGEIVFTSGGTESNNLAIRGHGLSAGRIVTSAVEHPSVAGPVRCLVDEGWRHDVLPVDATGRIDLDAARSILSTPADVVSVIAAQNETGVVQPVAEIAALARAANPDVVVHTDAAQAAGKIPVDVGELGVDLATIVSHKMYGPKGVGALFVRGHRIRRPLMVGGGQEAGVRPGTEPVAAIVGFGAACARARHLLADEAVRLAGLRERLWSKLSVRITGLRRTVPEDVETLPNTLHVLFPDCDAVDLLAAADTVAASVGAACHAGRDTASAALLAMGLSSDEAWGAMRLSLGRFTTAAEIERIVHDLVEAYLRISRDD